MSDIFSDLRDILDDKNASITALRGEVERLTVALREDRRARCLASERRVDELNAENGRLRAALRQIAGIDEWDNSEQGYVDKARAALEEKHE